MSMYTSDYGKETHSEEKAYRSKGYCLVPNIFLRHTHFFSDNVKIGWENTVVRGKVIPGCTQWGWM